MSTVINTNIKSLMAANALNINGRAMTHTMQSLSTGSRINQASDDAAGLRDAGAGGGRAGGGAGVLRAGGADRKSTRLNSSH